jgi:hypothetical protein
LRRNLTQENIFLPDDAKERDLLIRSHELEFGNEISHYRDYCLPLLPNSIITVNEAKRDQEEVRIYNPPDKKLLERQIKKYALCLENRLSCTRISNSICYGLRRLSSGKLHDYRLCKRGSIRDGSSLA